MRPLYDLGFLASRNPKTNLMMETNMLKHIFVVSTTYQNEHYTSLLFDTLNAIHCHVSIGTEMRNVIDMAGATILPIKNMMTVSY